MLFACKALLEEDILGSFQFQWCGITLPGKDIDVIQRKIMRDVQTAFPGGRSILSKIGPHVMLLKK